VLLTMISMVERWSQPHVK